MDLAISLPLTALVATVIAGFATRHWYLAKLRVCAERSKAQRDEIHQLEARLKEAKQQVVTLKTALAAVPPASVVRSGPPPTPAATAPKRTASALALDVALEDEPTAPAHGFADTMPFAGNDR